MELVVDLSTGGVMLRGRDDMQRLSVLAVADHPGGRRAEGALGALAAALNAHAMGTVAHDGVVLLPSAALRGS